MTTESAESEFGTSVDRLLESLRGTQPLHSDLDVSGLGDMGAILQSLVNSSPPVPPIDEDPVAIRLGLVSNGRPPQARPQPRIEDAPEELNPGPSTHHSPSERSRDRLRRATVWGVAVAACVAAALFVTAGGLLNRNSPEITVSATSTRSIDELPQGPQPLENEAPEPTAIALQKGEPVEPPPEDDDLIVRGTGTPGPTDTLPLEADPTSIDPPLGADDLSGLPDLDRPLGVAQGQGLVFYSTANAGSACQDNVPQPLFVHGTDGTWLEVATVPGPIRFASANQAGWLYLLSGCDWESPNVTGARFVDRQLSQLLDLGIHIGAHGWSGPEQVRFGDTVVRLSDGAIAAANDERYHAFGATSDGSFRYVVDQYEWNCGWVDDPPFPLLVEAGANRQAALSGDTNFFGGLRHLQFGPANSVAWLNECEGMGAAHPEVWVAQVDPTSGTLSDPVRLLPRANTDDVTAGQPFGPHGPNGRYGPDSIVFDAEGILHAWASIEGDLVHHIIN